MSRNILTNWGTFTIGQKVILSEEAKENDSYEEFKDTTLIIDEVDENDTGLGVKEPIFFIYS